MQVVVPISIGELVDKITILEIKQDRTQDPVKLNNINFELHSLRHIADKLLLPVDIDILKQQLYNVNLELWAIEDSKRKHEQLQLFDDSFIQLARLVYIKNDLRASIKRQINLLTNSSIVEEKVY